MHTYIGCKMADEACQQIENALNAIVNTTDKIGNMKKELKKTIHEAVSNLRNLTYNLKSNLLENTEENQMRNEVKQIKHTLEKWNATTWVRQVAPSVNNSPGLTNSRTEDIAPPTGGKKKLLSEVLCRKIEARHKLTVKPRHTQATEEIKRMIKSKIDPVNMKIAIRTFKGLKSGNVLIEADS